MKVKLLSALVASAAAMVSFNAQAGMVSDAHGNVGYDTAAECDAAVHNGTAKFYQSFTHKAALIRKGESKVQVATIRDLGQQYQYGACDIGVGHKLNRDGVAKALQGKYVPYSPDMPVNVYSDASGNPVRVTMKQCDNWFSGNAPRPVAAPAPAPVVERQPEPVAPVVAAPVVAAKSSFHPYVFGTIGAVQDGMRITDSSNSIQYLNKNKGAFGGQVGAGLQFNDYVGAEIFYQGSAKHKYTLTDTNENIRARNNTFGGRVTVGAPVTDKMRLFGKLGAASVQHKVNYQDSTTERSKDRKTRVTAGLGLTYAFTDHLALRADYDHYFRRSKYAFQDGSGTKFKGVNYLGAGLQYNF